MKNLIIKNLKTEDHMAIENFARDLLKMIPGGNDVYMAANGHLRQKNFSTHPQGGSDNRPQHTALPSQHPHPPRPQHTQPRGPNPAPQNGQPVHTRAPVRFPSTGPQHSYPAQTQPRGTVRVPNPAPQYSQPAHTRAPVRVPSPAYQPVLTQVGAPASLVLLPSMASLPMPGYNPRPQSKKSQGSRDIPNSRCLVKCFSIPVSLTKHPITVHRIPQHTSLPTSTPCQPLQVQPSQPSA